MTTSVPVATRVNNSSKADDEAGPKLVQLSEVSFKNEIGNDIYIAVQRNDAPSPKLVKIIIRGPTSTFDATITLEESVCLLEVLGNVVQEEQ